MKGIEFVLTVFRSNDMSLKITHLLASSTRVDMRCMTKGLLRLRQLQKFLLPMFELSIDWCAFLIGLLPTNCGSAIRIHTIVILEIQEIYFASTNWIHEKVRRCELRRIGELGWQGRLANACYDGQGDKPATSANAGTYELTLRMLIIFD